MKAVNPTIHAAHKRQNNSSRSSSSSLNRSEIWFESGLVQISSFSNLIRTIWQRCIILESNSNNLATLHLVTLRLIIQLNEMTNLFRAIVNLNSLEIDLEPIWQRSNSSPNKILSFSSYIEPIWQRSIWFPLRYIFQLNQIMNLFRAIVNWMNQLNWVLKLISNRSGNAAILLNPSFNENCQYDLFAIYWHIEFLTSLIHIWSFQSPIETIWQRCI